MAKKTTPAPNHSRKLGSASAFNVLRSFVADFGDPAVQDIFPEATQALEKAKKIARALVADLKVRALAKPDARYYIPTLAMKNGAYYFGDMLDRAILPFLSLEPSDAAHVLPMSPLTGITAAEAANIFLFDEEEVLVPLTALALTLFEQAENGKTHAVVHHQSVFLVQLISHLELGVNVNGYVDLPREKLA